MKKFEFKLQTNRDKYGRYLFQNLDSKTILEIANNMFEFLKSVHPELDNKEEQLNNLNKIESTQICIEIRALKRCYRPTDKIYEDVKGTIYSPAYKNIRLFSYDNKEKEKLIKFISALNKSGICCCLYYSVFCFNNKELAISQAGTKAAFYNNRIAKNNAIGSSILIADFDSISESEFNKQLNRFKDIGIPPSMCVFSGHGYQTIWCLNIFSTDRDLLKKFTNTLYQKAFPIDIVIKDEARIMRMPFWSNAKDLSKRDLVEANNHQIISTYVTYSDNQIYSLDYIYESLNNLPNINSLKESRKKEKSVPKNNQAHEKLITMFGEVEQDKKEKDVYMNINSIYLMLEVNSIEKIIRNMLTGFRKGYADNVIFFLSIYFREHGYDARRIIDILNILKTLDTYNYAWNDADIEGKVNRFYFEYKQATSYSIYKKCGLEIFGQYKKNEDNEIITIYNYVLDNASYYKSTGVYIFLQILYLYSYTGQRQFLLEDISKISNIDKSTVIRNITPMIRRNDTDYADLYLLDKVKHKKDKGYSLCLSIIESQLQMQGFVKITFEQINNLLLLTKEKKITTTELVVILLLKRFCTKDNMCCVSQKKLSQMLGFKTQGYLSRSLKKLEDMNLIQRTKVQINSVQFKHNYRLIVFEPINKSIVPF